MTCVECGRSWVAEQRTGRPRQYCSRSCQARAYRRRRDRGRLSAAGRSSPSGPASSTLLEHAITLADAEGISAVSLRAVAERSGRTLGDVQREFGSRDRLVSMMVHRVLARRDTAPSGAEEPAETLVRLAEAEWRSYREHPWLVGVLASTRPPLVPAVLDASHAAVEAFAALGLDTDAAVTRYLAFSGYLQGMALLLAAEDRESSRSATSLRAWWAEEARRLDRTGALRRHPWLDELSRRPAAYEFDADAVFREGLDLVLRGLVAPVRP